MAKTYKLVTLILLLSFVGLFTTNFFIDNNALLSLTITFGVCAYHLLMRYVVGLLVNLTMKKVNPSNLWFREKSFEKSLYSLIKVKKWKRFMPSFSPDSFDLKKNSIQDIILTTCRSEMVHEIIIVLSFLPILLYIPFGTLAVFISTSIISALVDAIFVVMQRYNRPRLLKLQNKLNIIRQ